VSENLGSGFRRWFWERPRAHGEVIEGRRVSSVELLYDLVYIAVIAQTTHTLGNNLNLAGLFDFVVLFGMAWIGWINGTLYLELHGRGDGRTRSYVFLQMAILCLLAVFTGSAPTTTGAQFALTYVGFLLVVGWLFYTVSKVDTPETARTTRRYASIMFVSAAAIAVSAFLPADLRVAVWAAFTALWLTAMIFLGTRPRTFSFGIAPTESLVERLDTFTLIVLGEVVVGVVAGLIAAPQDFQTIATGVVALVIGLGLWWIYFDIVGGRPSRRGGPAVTSWILSRLPITLAIAAAGAAMVGLVEHAADPVTPGPTALLLAGAVAVVFLTEIVTVWSFVDSGRDRAIYRPLLLAMTVAAAVSVAVGFLPLPPWGLAVALNAILIVVWLIAASRFVKVGVWPPGSERPGES
jgi:low temperature requirement protein LtrA